MRHPFLNWNDLDKRKSILYINLTILIHLFGYSACKYCMSKQCWKWGSAAGQISSFPKTGCSILYDKVKVKRLPKLWCLHCWGFWQIKLGAAGWKGNCAGSLEGCCKVSINPMSWMLLMARACQIGFVHLCAVRSRRAVSLGRRNGAQMQGLFPGRANSDHYYSSDSDFVCVDVWKERSSGASVSGIGGHNAHGHTERHRASSSPQVRSQATRKQCLCLCNSISLSDPGVWSWLVSRFLLHEQLQNLLGMAQDWWPLTVKQGIAILMLEPCLQELLQILAGGQFQQCQRHLTRGKVLKALDPWLHLTLFHKESMSD